MSRWKSRASEYSCSTLELLQLNVDPRQTVTATSFVIVLFWDVCPAKNPHDDCRLDDAHCDGCLASALLEDYDAPESNGRNLLVDHTQHGPRNRPPGVSDR